MNGPGAPIPKERFPGDPPQRQVSGVQSPLAMVVGLLVLIVVVLVLTRVF